MVRPSRSVLLCLSLSLSFVLPMDLVAQTRARGPRSDADREKVSQLIEKGDIAAARKLMASFVAETAAAAPSGSVDYEEIKACGFYPQETRLECIIEIKRRVGYSGPIGSFGSMEHVYFCVDWFNTGTFTQDGSAGQGSVQMHNESAGAVPPWHYAVYRDFNPFGGFRTSNAGATTTSVTNGPTRTVRAILSWFDAPTGCNYVPVWGNVLDFRIRLDPVR